MEQDDNFNILVVDDTMGEDDPFVVELNLEFPNATVIYYSKVEEALSFVDKHMSERIIIFMDCLFGSIWEGVDAVRQLRQKTSLIYIIMMSANNPEHMGSKYIIELINADNIFFIRNNDVKGAKDRVCQIQRLWKSQFDCILERWLVKHPDKKQKEVYRDAKGRYTWEDVLRELRLRTPVGRSIEQVLNEYYIDQIEKF